MLWPVPDEKRKMKLLILFLTGCLGGLVFSPQLYAQNPDAKKPVLTDAVICEGIKGSDPYNEAAVFSISAEKVFCFTAFEPVPEKTSAYHSWFHRDTLNTKIKLTLNPPRWATFSNIQLRESDKGPWRVEIADTEGRVFRILRFSVTD